MKWIAKEGPGPVMISLSRTDILQEPRDGRTRDRLTFSNWVHLRNITLTTLSAATEGWFAPARAPNYRPLPLGTTTDLTPGNLCSPERIGEIRKTRHPFRGKSGELYPSGFGLCARVRFVGKSVWRVGFELFVFIYVFNTVRPIYQVKVDNFTVMQQPFTMENFLQIWRSLRIREEY